ncbi:MULTISPECIES: hypothetical protein [Gordonia]|jgi:hypothetical protein|uniref:Uncharacterized protein n=1 Tax=Gordonia malaquae NBRC 108250 TaxID=1223542 RepID=M3TG26_GORML|nr:hypothetical protein [Gordonia malaquae]GAC80416.1 hypothetical protein GM1_017_00750 [Gordonia malaquae NBRC 108250]SEB51503.1 hypothetical protein SAMN04488550_0223 [Gordonia malaquae]
MSDESTAERIAEAVLAIPGVVDLHSGLFGEVATYLPGRRVPGIAIRDDDGEVHLVVDLAHDLQSVATAAREAAEEITGKEFAVVVEDVESDRKAG